MAHHHRIGLLFLILGSDLAIVGAIRQDGSPLWLPAALLVAGMILLLVSDGKERREG